jgi:hypothetical protein
VPFGDTVNSIRVLPLRVAPMPGEALDSWLEAIAYSHRVPWADLNAALGGVILSGHHLLGPPIDRATGRGDQRGHRH